MSLTTVSAGPFAGPDVCFIFAPDGYDEPEILRSREPSVCLMGADAGQPIAVGQLRKLLEEPLTYVAAQHMCPLPC
jgi:hypothetical protein